MFKKIKEKLSNMKDKIRKLKSEDKRLLPNYAWLIISIVVFIIGLFIIRRNLQRIYPNTQSIGEYFSQIFKFDSDYTKTLINSFRLNTGVIAPTIIFIFQIYANIFKFVTNDSNSFIITWYLGTIIGLGLLLGHEVFSILFNQ